MPLQTLEALNRRRKNQNSKVFKTLAENLLAGMIARWDECVGRILLGDGTGGYSGSTASDQVPVCWNLGFWV
jgi:hypothetical protein